jgi:hypothetical protein
VSPEMNLICMHPCPFVTFTAAQGDVQSMFHYGSFRGAPAEPESRGTRNWIMLLRATRGVAASGQAA